ncbi:MAG TPA: addiction module antidote protein [Burkholderiaceae bacterium]|nr:addiction module antidote protein [Burkholderiaceae bacterium]
MIEELRADPELAAEYINAAADDDDPRVYLAALKTVAEAQGMAVVAKAAGVPRESLYRALSASGNPRFSTLHAILKAAGLKMAVKRA